MENLEKPAPAAAGAVGGETEQNCLKAERSRQNTERAARKTKRVPPPSRGEDWGRDFIVGMAELAAEGVDFRNMTLDDLLGL